MDSISLAIICHGPYSVSEQLLSVTDSPESSRQLRSLIQLLSVIILMMLTDNYYYKESR